MIIFYETLSVRKRKRMKNYHYDIIQQQNDIFNKSFPFRIKIQPSINDN